MFPDEDDTHSPPTKKQTLASDEDVDYYCRKVWFETLEELREQERSAYNLLKDATFAPINIHGDG